MSFKKFSTHQDAHNKIDTAQTGKPAEMQTVLRPVTAPEPAPTATAAPSKP